MNAPDMLDHALGRLEGDAAQQATRDIDRDPMLAARLDRLSHALHQMLDDDETEDDATYDPPPGLAARTVAFVAAETRQRAAVLEFVPRRPRFRREDFAVAATIFLASLLALTPAIFRSRERWGRAACANNLQRVGLRLNQYAALNQEYPFVSTGDPVPRVGAIYSRLAETGFPIEPKDLHCPCSGSACGKSERLPPISAILAAMQRSEAELCRMIENDFAVHIGYNRTPKGDPGPLPAFPHRSVPILADRPNHDGDGRVLAGNSPNHGGQGQNVLFADGHVSWHDSRWVSPVDSDLYLNTENRPAYGTSLSDSVLMPSVFRVKDR